MSPERATDQDFLALFIPAMAGTIRYSDACRWEIREGDGVWRRDGIGIRNRFMYEFAGTLAGDRRWDKVRHKTGMTQGQYQLFAAAREGLSQ
jgi:hypothetical protein